MHWYALMVPAASGFEAQRRVLPELRAVSRIGDEGYRAYCPTTSRLQRPRRGARLRERRIEPLWPGYMFAALDARALQRLDFWPEVLDVVRTAGQPHALGEAVIASIRALDAALEYADVTGTPAETLQRVLAVGDLVEHRSSAYASLRGRISRVDRDNVELVVELLGSQRTVRAKARDVEVVA